MRQMSNWAAMWGILGASMDRMGNMTSGNRIHQNRAPAGSELEASRMAAAQAKRDRKNARRAQESGYARGIEAK